MVDLYLNKIEIETSKEFLLTSVYDKMQLYIDRWKEENDQQ